MGRVFSADGERIGRHIEKLARFNSTPGRGVTRFSYTEQDRQARNYLLDRAAQLGLQVTIDPVAVSYTHLTLPTN